MYSTGFKNSLSPSHGVDMALRMIFVNLSIIVIIDYNRLLVAALLDIKHLSAGVRLPATTGSMRARNHGELFTSTYWQRHCTLMSHKSTRCSAIAERPRCRVSYSCGQRWKTGTGRQYFTNIIGLSSNTVPKIYHIRWRKTQNKGYYGVQGHSRILVM